MKIHGISQQEQYSEDLIPADLAEITLVAAPSELRRIAKFLENCAAGMDEYGKAWVHEHLSDQDKSFKNSPHFVVYNPDYDG